MGPGYVKVTGCHRLLILKSLSNFCSLETARVDYNNWEEIRDCLNEFISLRITMSGTSAVSASDVYGEHVYTFDDVCVGWR